MTRRKAILGISAAGLLIICAAAVITVYVYRAHARDFCFGSGRSLSDKEFYKKAMLAAYKDYPFLIELNQIVFARTPDGKDRFIRAENPVGVEGRLRGRVDLLMENGEFVRECCSRGWRGIERRPPNFLEVLWGVSRRGVYIDREAITVTPESLSPEASIRQNDVWSKAERLNVVGPILHTERRGVFIPMTTCGDVANIRR